MSRPGTCLPPETRRRARAPLRSDDLKTLHTAPARDWAPASHLRAHAIRTARCRSTRRRISALQEFWHSARETRRAVARVCSRSIRAAVDVGQKCRDGGRIEAFGQSSTLPWAIEIRQHTRCPDHGEKQFAAAESPPESREPRPQPQRPHSGECAMDHAHPRSQCVCDSAVWRVPQGPACCSCRCQYHRRPPRHDRTRSTKGLQAGSRPEAAMLTPSASEAR